VSSLKTLSTVHRLILIACAEDEVPRSNSMRVLSEGKGDFIQPTAEDRIEASLRQQAPVRSKTESDIILQPCRPTASTLEGMSQSRFRPPLHLDISQLSDDERYRSPNWSAQSQKSQTAQPTSSEPDGKHWVREPPEGDPKGPRPQPHRHITQDRTNSFASGAASSSSKVTAIRHRNTMPESQELRRIFGSHNRE
jgi:hypothetical protein